MKRIVKLLKKYSIFMLIVKFLKKVFYRVFAYFDKLDRKLMEKYNSKKQEKNTEKYKQIESLFKKSKYKYIFVFYPYTEWNLPIFQRPQQIALSMTQERDDVLYFFCTANYVYDNVDIIQKLNENLYLCTDYDFLTKIKTKKRIIHLYSTDIVSDLSTVNKALSNGDKILYEYIDEIHEDITQSIPDNFLEKHNFLLQNEKCYVVATANKLLKDVQNIRHKNYILATNGVTLKDFTMPTKLPVPPEIKHLKKDYSKIVGYYGALAKWFDYELLDKAAKAYPNYAFVLIGVEYDDSLKNSQLLNNSNVHFLGKIDYNMLIQYSSQMDLLTIPFLINEITESTSPVKLFEYMATQKPILTTAMKECKKYKSVNIAKTHEDFIKKIPEVIAKGQDPKYLDLLLKEASKNTWEQKSKDIIAMLSK